MGGFISGNARLGCAVGGFGDAVTVMNGHLEADEMRFSDNQRSIVVIDGTADLTDCEIE